MKQKYDIPIPLKMVKDFEEDFPLCYSLCSDIRAKSGDKWNSKDVYIPIDLAAVVIKEIYKENKYPTHCVPFSILSAWRQSKEIYTFDRDTANLLFKQASAEDDMRIPTEVLRNLPFNCFYVNTQDSPFFGFFVYLNQECELPQGIVDKYEIVFLLITLDYKSIPYRLHLRDNMTLLDNIKENIKDLKKISPDIDETSAESTGRLEAGDITKLLQLVLYICSENADVEENETQKTITRRPAKNTPPKDVYREIRKWDIGFKVGKKIRYTYEHKDQLAHAEGSKKRPHVRRGHYHHFWRGKRDGERQLVLRWIPPLFVNGDEEDIIPTITDMSK